MNKELAGALAAGHKLFQADGKIFKKREPGRIFFHNL